MLDIKGVTDVAPGLTGMELSKFGDVIALNVWRGGLDRLSLI